MSTRFIPPMSRAEYEALPAIVKRFVTWEDARQGKVIDLPEPKNPEAYKYFTEALPSLLESTDK